MVHERIQEFSSGGWGVGGVHVSLTKKSSDVFFCFFLSPQLINFKAIYHFSRFQRGSNIFQGGGGSNFFHVGTNCLFPIETHITCDFPGGTDLLPPPPPPPPPLHPHLWFPIVSASYNIDPPETNMHFISNWSIFRMWLRGFAMSP